MLRCFFSKKVAAFPRRGESCSNHLMHIPRRQTRARIGVLLGAIAFAASVPAGKILLRGLAPMAISGGLYLAAGLLCLGLLLADSGRKGTVEGRPRGGEWW